MSLIRLDITDFRNLGVIKLEPIANGFNFFFGHNGSGKTSLLEAVYYLSRGRSFRSLNAAHIVRNSAEKFSIFAQVQTQHVSLTKSVGIERKRRGEARVRVDGADIPTVSELVEITPTLLINSNCHNLLDSGPVFRRKYLDWGSFYANKDFLPIWKTYQRALRQRNAVLRKRLSKKEVDLWTGELIQSGLLLDQLRREFVQQLLSFLTSLIGELLTLPGLSISYFPGWDEACSYQDALFHSFDKDWAFGYTQLGPHRADFKVIINGSPAKDILSRGQQKLFVCAMMVAQGALLQRCVNRKPIYLIDDLPSELDVVSRAKLMALLSRQEAQVFLTAVDREALVDTFGDAPLKMFHVEHGNAVEA